MVLGVRASGTVFSPEQVDYLLLDQMVFGGRVHMHALDDIRRELSTILSNDADSPDVLPLRPMCAGIVDNFVSTAVECGNPDDIQGVLNVLDAMVREHLIQGFIIARVDPMTAHEWARKAFYGNAD